jgi:hypothetical protein
MNGYQVGDQVLVQGDSSVFTITDVRERGSSIASYKEYQITSDSVNFYWVGGPALSPAP